MARRSTKKQAVVSVVSGNETLSKNLAKYGRLLSVFVAIVVLGGLVAILHSGNSTVKHCYSEACFTPEFTSCNTGATLQASDIALGTVKYKIIKDNFGGSGCEMTLTFLKNINPAWENKPLECIFNNQLSLDKSISAVFDDILSGKNTDSCSGPLVKVIKNAG